MTAKREFVEACQEAGLEITVLPDDSREVFLRPRKPLSQEAIHNLRDSFARLNMSTEWKFVLLSHDVEFVNDAKQLKAIEKRLDAVERWIENEDTRALEASEY